MEDLPQNCIFNKVVTGCGGTTIALFNERNYIIAVPTTELITNKTGLIEAGIAAISSPNGDREQEVFGLFGTFSPDVKGSLREYVATGGVKKILCTYDKVKYLHEYVNTKDYQILVDEYHQLLKAYSYRQKAVCGVLENFRRYKSFCFLSATPISPDFTPSVLDGIEQIDAVWESVDMLIVSLEQTNNPYVKAANIINSYKVNGYVEVNGRKSYEAFFFINSVTDIASILKHCSLTDEEVKIVCADDEANRAKLNGYTISNSRAENRKFTFITSKSFEGADYYSATGLCYVVSNSNNRNTLLDISTDIYQIAGRIRTESNPFRNKLVHIFNTTGKRRLNLEISYDEYKQVVEEEIEEAKAILEVANTKAKKMAEKMIKSEYITRDDDGVYQLNDILIKLDLMNYKIERQIYKTGVQLRKAYNTNGTMTTDINYEKLDETIEQVCKKLSFKEAFLRYVELKQSFDFGDRTNEIVRQQPLVVDAYHQLGADKVKALRYIKKEVEKALTNNDATKSQEEKVTEIMLQSVAYPKTYTCSELYQIIATAYHAVGITTIPKASHITRWFECKKTTQRIGGVSTTVYKVFNPSLL